MKKLAIAGTSGFAREILASIQQLNQINHEYEILGFIGETNDKQLINGFPIIGNDEEVNSTSEPISVVIAVGEPWLKKKIRNHFNNPLISFPSIIHPSVIIGDKDFVTIGKGCLICAGVILTTNIEINDFVTLNLMCTVGHDTVINEYSSFMPSVNISGEVTIEKGVYVGTGAKIINLLEIGANSIIGAGAVVINNIPTNSTVVGVPGKVIKVRRDK